MTLPPDTASATLTAARPARVLIIDDDELTRVTFAQMLRLEGHDVWTVPSADAALHEAAQLVPDAIIVDLHMPAMDGLTFVQRLRAQEQDVKNTMTPVAIVTGDYSLTPAMTAELTRLGVTLCFKPLWLEDLVVLANGLLAPASDSGTPLPH